MPQTTAPVSLDRPRPMLTLGLGWLLGSCLLLGACSSPRRDGISTATGGADAMPPEGTLAGNSNSGLGGGGSKTTGGEGGQPQGGGAGGGAGASRQEAGSPVKPGTGATGGSTGTGPNGSGGQGGRTDGSGGKAGRENTAGSAGKADAGSGGSKGTAGGTPDAGAATPTCSGTGWKLVWSDEFDGPAGSAVDSKKWTMETGGDGWGNSELEYYTSGTNNAAMDGTGNLVITAKKESQGGREYTSARLKTLGHATWTYGRVEGRLKLPEGQGLWPAFWMLGEDITTNNWPGCGEIDVMENVGKEPNVVHGTIHGPGYSGGAGPTAKTTAAAAASSFHVYSIEWEPEAIRWYVDDALYSTKTPQDLPNGATWVYAHPFFILLNVAVGGTWPGAPDASTTFPQRMVVDYVRVCQR